jgi:arylsulfatase B/arylsulfatase I/J
MILLRGGLVSLCVCLSIASPTSKPNHILFVMVDDLGFNDVSYRNTSDLSSPTIDKLAMSGVRLERYYTHNLCSPSRTSFLSGRFASTIGMQGCVIINGQAVDLPRNVSTVAKRLSSGGFRTAAFGKWDAGMTTWDYTPTCRGFDYFYGFYGPAQDHFTHKSGALDLRENFDAVHNETGVYSTHLYTQKAQQWITAEINVHKSAKTFSYLAYQAMHAPIEAPAEYIERCSHVTTTNKRRTYCGMMLALDEGIANVTNTYKSLGIWESTVLVLAADNGGHIGSSGNNAPLRGEHFVQSP